MQAAKATAEAAERAAMHARDDFLQSPEVREPALSPGGAFLSFKRDSDQEISLFIRHIDSGATHRVMKDARDVSVHWSGDSRHLWLVQADGIGIHDVMEENGQRIFRFDESRRQRFKLVDSHAPGHALLSEKVAIDGTWRYRYLSIDTRGKVTASVETGKVLLDALLDRHGRVRYATGYDGDDFDTVTWRIDGTERTELMRCPLPERCIPVAFHRDEDDETLWMLAHHGGDLKTLQRYRTSKPGWEILHRDPRGIADARSIIFEAGGKEWLAMAYEPDRIEWHGRTEEQQKLIGSLQDSLPGTNLDIMPANNGSRWLVRAGRGGWQFDRYFLFDTDKQELTPLFKEERMGKIPPADLADIVPVHWRGKDGMALHGYIFLPKGIDLASAPLIAQIHGGPYGRSSGSSDAGAYLLANRGYIVFKPNFRASTGYGVNYVKATEGNFGKSGVLDDILTGMDHLIANGIGNPDRQAVIGHSFGGYASLLAITHHPERFAFAVPGAAPVDMAWTMKDIAIEGGSALPIDGPPIEVLFPRYNVPYGEPAWHARMHRDAPISHAANLKTPTYLWAGAQDDRVAVESLVRYVVEANREYKPLLLIDPESGHSPRGKLNSEAYAWLIEMAADRHFGGGATPPSKQLQQFLGRNLKHSNQAGHF
ncbi:MAG: prolyl oligopeptidase family serine peptidase [Gammaproteobacteria bacterium]|nr:prolyl oligopeptidase family serine peptidase [Gammaproteobacteria bacterium]